MTALETYRHFILELQSLYSPTEAEAITKILFETIARLDRSKMLAEPAQIPDEAIVKKLFNALESLKAAEPVQYVLKEAWFYRLRFNVSRAVLIPRPETEELISMALAFAASIENPNVIDIGTGSGCIAIAVKKNCAVATIDAIDISEDALLVAKENASMHQALVDFQQLDFLDVKQWEVLPAYDIIISNPPYIPLQEKNSIDKNVVAYEPNGALFVPDDQPLLFYEKIALFSKNHLKKNGRIFVECHENFATAVANVFESNGFLPTVLEDMFGKNRMVSASRYH